MLRPLSPLGVLIKIALSFFAGARVAEIDSLLCCKPEVALRTRFIRMQFHFLMRASAWVHILADARRKKRILEFAHVSRFGAEPAP
jgi:hypothetical protein